MLNAEVVFPDGILNIVRAHLLKSPDYENHAFLFGTTVKINKKTRILISRYWLTPDEMFIEQSKVELNLKKRIYS